MFRPGVIQPLDRIRSKTRLYQLPCFRKASEATSP
jgi:hypothetical protein